MDMGNRVKTEGLTPEQIRRNAVRAEAQRAWRAAENAAGRAIPDLRKRMSEEERAARLERRRAIVLERSTQRRAAVEAARAAKRAARREAVEARRLRLRQESAARKAEKRAAMEARWAARGGRYAVSAETKARMSAAQRGKKRAPASDETRRRITESQLKRHGSAKRHYIDGRELHEEVCLSKRAGALTKRALEMLMLIADNAIHRLKYVDPKDREDCLQSAYMEVWQRWRSYDPNKGSNAFAYFTEVVKNGFARGWNSIHPKRYGGTVRMDGMPSGGWNEMG